MTVENKMEALRARCLVEEPDGNVKEQHVIGIADNISHTTESRVGSRGPTLSKVNTPLRIVCVLISFFIIASWNILDRHTNIFLDAHMYQIYSLAS